jgi:DNA invertase Pin-like site-specific DNA recombinase
LAEKERALISRRTKDALAAAKARGVRLGGLNAKGLENQRLAAERAERLRSVFGELAGMSARKAAEELNQRGIEAPAGGKWFAWRGGKGGCADLRRAFPDKPKFEVQVVQEGSGVVN